MWRDRFLHPAELTVVDELQGQGLRFEWQQTASGRVAFTAHDDEYGVVACVEMWPNAPVGVVISELLKRASGAMDGTILIADD